MKKIKLTKGQFTVIDDCDFEWLSQYKWCAAWDKKAKSYYAKRYSKRINGKQCPISMAREILGLKKGDKREADHRNHNTLDNKRSNLRIVSHQENGWNRKNPKGYYWHKSNGKWMAKIKFNGRSIYLGYFDTEAKAHVAYLNAKKIYHKIA